MSNFCAGRRRIASYTPSGGLSASTHRFLVLPHPHVRFVRVWAARDDLSDGVLSGGVCPSRVLATMSLNLATLEHQSVDQIETHAFRPGWDTDMAQWLVMWATAFLPDLADPLGVAESLNKQTKGYRP